jgi:hypothetical protein
MARQQAEQVLRERRGKAYDPCVVDQFLKILDRLEQMEAEEQRKSAALRDAQPHGAPGQLDVISATTAEEREFNELRRDLPRASSLADAIEALFRHIRRVLPASSLAIYSPAPGTNDVMVTGSVGMGSSSMEGLRVPVGDRISGWVFAHAQGVMNSDAALELGPVARTFSIPLRYASAVPIIDGGIVGVMVVYSGEPFERDHRRLLENASTILVSSLPQSIVAELGVPRSSAAQPEQKPSIMRAVK